MRNDAYIYFNEHPKQIPLVKWIQGRFAKNQNLLMICVGEVGSGKSISMLELCSQVDPNFGPENIVFDIDSFMKLIKSGNLKPGSMILFDEAGVGLRADQWYDIQIRMFRLFLETWRHLRIGAILTVPDASFVEAGARKMVQIMAYMKRIDRVNKIAYAEVRRLNNNPFVAPKKYYMGTHFRIKIADQMIIKVRQFKFPLPNEELLKAYDIKKNVFSKGLNDEISFKIGSSMNTLGKTYNLDNLPPETKRIVEAWPNCKSMNEVAQKLNKSYNTVRTMRNALIAKGLGHLVPGFPRFKPNPGKEVNNS